jgi:uridine kinase
MEPSCVGVIGVGGGVGNGKSSFSRRLVEAFGENCSMLSLDSFYKELPDVAYPDCNFDHPDSIDFEALIEVVTLMRLGRTAKVPVYDMRSRLRIGEAQVKSYQILIVEGDLALWEPRLRALMDLKVFVKVDDDERLARRLVRDTIERRLELADVLSQRRRYAKFSYAEFILPSMAFADVIVPIADQDQVALQVVATVTA